MQSTNGWVRVRVGPGCFLAFCTLAGCGEEARVRADVDEATQAAGGELCGNGALDNDEFCDSDEVHCDVLGGSYRNGVAHCRTDCRGYVLDSCELYSDSGDVYEVVKPATRDTERHENARCSDGTPFSVFVSLNGLSNTEWLIYLQPGGSCDDRTLLCRERLSKPARYTEFQEPDRTLITEDDAVSLQSAIQDRDPAVNPDFHAANLAVLHYCSNDLYSGGTSERRPSTGDPERGWYFSGRLNVRAALDILVQRYGLNDGDAELRVLFAGSSAGGFGALYNADQAAETLPNASKRGDLKIVSDSGWLQGTEPARSEFELAAVVEEVESFYAAQVSPACEAWVALRGLAPAECGFSETLTASLTAEPPVGLGLPVLIQTSWVDTSAIRRVGLEKTDPEVSLWAESVVSSLDRFRWVFSAQTPYHVLLTKPEKFNARAGELSFRDLLGRFWREEPPQRVLADTIALP